MRLDYFSIEKSKSQELFCLILLFFQEISGVIQISVCRTVAMTHCRAGACSRRRKMEHFSDFPKENNRIVPTARHFVKQNARRETASALR
jgi:hypothetical protein